MEIVDILTVLAIGAFIGFGIVGFYVWILYQRIRLRVDRMIDEVIAEAEENLVGLNIELDKGLYFCYNSKDKQFVCQGSTVEEIRQAFGQRYPGKTAYLAGGNPEVVAEFKTELRKLAINEDSTSK